MICLSCENVKEKRCAERHAETVSVYTKLDGATLVVDGGSEKAQAGYLAQAMLSDILALETGKSDNALLRSLNGVKNGLYSVAFVEMSELVKSGKAKAVSATIRHAVLSLENDERYLKKVRSRMEKEGVYPGSSAYVAIQQACYYVSAWKGQLKKMSCLVYVPVTEIRFLWV